jgi:hypothetical protein
MSKDPSKLASEIVAEARLMGASPPDQDLLVLASEVVRSQELTLAFEEAAQEVRLLRSLLRRCEKALHENVELTSGMAAEPGSLLDQIRAALSSSHSAVLDK